MKRTRLLLIGAMVILGLATTGLPAQAELAENSGIIIFRGTATVCGATIPGKNINDDCGGQSNDKGEQGLYGPGPDLRNWTKRVGNFRLRSGPLLAPWDLFNALIPECRSIGQNSFGQPPVFTPRPMSVKSCSIAIDGKLAPVEGFGAACGWVHGHSGYGELSLHKTVADRVYQLENVGWMLSLIGILPLNGTYQLKQAGAGDSTIAPVEKGTKPGTPGKQGQQTRTLNNTSKTRKITRNTSSSGPFTGVALVQGGQGCFKVPGPTSGAATFNLIVALRLF